LKKVISRVMRADWVALIFVSIAFGHTPDYSAGRHIRDSALRDACLLPNFYWYSFCLSWRDDQAELTWVVN